jgi:hypothetical protein
MRFAMRSRLTLLAVALCFAAGPVLADSDKDESGHGKHGKKEEKHENKKEKRHEKHGEHGDSYFHRNGYERLSIPKGHYPPPGMCRAWYPDRPPGHQPPPQKCGAPVPHGAWLIEHPREQQGHVRITAYNWSTPPAPPPAPPVVVYRDAPPPPPTVVYREVQRPIALPPVLAVGEFNVADGVLVRVVVR